MECRNCKTDVKQTKGKRQKLYCSQKCRVEFFRKESAKANPPKKRGRPPKQVFDAPKMDSLADEHAMWVEVNDKSKKTGKTLGGTLEKALGSVVSFKPPSKETRKVIHSNGEKSKEILEPVEGTNAYFLRYGAFYKKDIKK